MPRYFFCKKVFFTIGPFINLTILYFFTILIANLNDSLIKLFDFVVIFSNGRF